LAKSTDFWKHLTHQQRPEGVDFIAISNHKVARCSQVANHECFRILPVFVMRKMAIVAAMVSVRGGLGARRDRKRVTFIHLF
jgi:nitrate/nitrite transporter NarK